MQLWKWPYAMATMPDDQKVVVHTAGGTTYRNKAMQMSGKSQFPFLVDSNTGARCFCLLCRCSC